MQCEIRAECDGCNRTRVVHPKAREFRGDPPDGWRRVQWFCAGCIADPKRTGEPMTVHPHRGAGYDLAPTWAACWWFAFVWCAFWVVFLFGLGCCVAIRFLLKGA